MYNRSLTLVLVVLSSLLFAAGLSAQSDNEIKTLNYYVDFLNESTHGLTVAHILFVNYNKDLNKYVDLESYKINAHITNQELGASIFDNPDINTKDNHVSAMKLSVLTKQKSSALKKKTASALNKYVDEITVILNKINNLRFEIETFITDNDLNIDENIYRSYELLEKAVSLFDAYELKHGQLYKVLQSELKYEYKPMDFAFQEIHSASIELLRDLRNGNSTKHQSYLKRIDGAIENFRKKDFGLTSDEQALSDDLVRQIKEMIGFVKTKISGSAIPDSYKLYGTEYYVHNQILLAHFNSISPGFVVKMNDLLSSRNKVSLSYDDRPVIFKVVYPQKMEEIESIVTNNAIDLKPSTTRKPELIPTKPSLPEENYFVIEFYDPNLLDRDSISVTYNDELVLENYKLVEEPYKIRRKLDSPNEKVVINLTAENLGIISPNTVAIKYRYNGKGKKENVYLNLQEGETYELIIEPED